VLAAVNQYLLPASRLWQMTISGTDGHPALHVMRAASEGDRFEFILKTSLYVID